MKVKAKDKKGKLENENIQWLVIGHNLKSAKNRTSGAMLVRLGSFILLCFKNWLDALLFFICVIPHSS